MVSVLPSASSAPPSACPPEPVALSGPLATLSVSSASETESVTSRTETAPPNPIPAVPLLAAPPTAALAEKLVPVSVPAVEKATSPPPRPLPPRLTPAPPVAKLPLIEVSRMTSAVSGPAAKIGPALAGAARRSRGERRAAGGAVEGERAPPDGQAAAAGRDRPAPAVGGQARAVVDADRGAVLEVAVDDRQRAAAQKDAAAGPGDRHTAGADRPHDAAVGQPEPAQRHHRRGGRGPDLEQAEVRGSDRPVAADRGDAGRVGAGDHQILDDHRQRVRAVVRDAERHGAGDGDGVAAGIPGDAAADRGVGVGAGDRIHQRAGGPDLDPRGAREARLDQGAGSDDEEHRGNTSHERHPLAGAAPDPPSGPTMLPGMPGWQSCRRRPIGRVSSPPVADRAAPPPAR